MTSGEKRIAVPAPQRKRSVAIALGLGALAVMFFIVTVVQMQGNVAKRMQLEGKTADGVVVSETPAGGETTVGQ